MWCELRRITRCAPHALIGLFWRERAAAAAPPDTRTSTRAHVHTRARLKKVLHTVLLTVGQVVLAAGAKRRAQEACLRACRAVDVCAHASCHAWHARTRTAPSHGSNRRQASPLNMLHALLGVRAIARPPPRPRQQGHTCTHTHTQTHRHTDTHTHTRVHLTMPHATMRAWGRHASSTASSTAPPTFSQYLCTRGTCGAQRPAGGLSGGSGVHTTWIARGACMLCGQQA
jgi:hypothetical protein